VVTDTAAASAPDSSGRGAAEAGLRVAHGRALSDSPGSGHREPPCGCVVEGTVEVRSERPLSGGLRVVVTLAEEPAPRDTVELFMGAPRAFDLGRVPCGSHRLAVHPLSSRRFALVAPAGEAFDCATGRPQQYRLVLEPR
jgi:hypothetical protein